MAERRVSSQGEEQDLSDRVRKSEDPEFEGVYSDVYRGVFDMNVAVAVKVIKRVATRDRMQRKLQREGTIWAQLEHRNILPLYGFAKHIGDFGAFISPWCYNGDAARFLSEGLGRWLDFDERLLMWTGVADGVAYLHSRDIIHGDLKLKNIIIGDDGTPKICDFGLVRVLFPDGPSGMTTTTPHGGTLRYVSPEMFGGRAIPTSFSDIWALGCIGLEIVYKRRLYSESNDYDVMADIRVGVKPGRRPTTLEPRDEVVWEILEQCWDEKPGERPTAADITNCLQPYEETPSEMYSGPETTQEPFLDQGFVESPENTMSNYRSSQNDYHRRNTESSENQPSASESHLGPRLYLPIRASSSAKFTESELSYLNQIAQGMNLSWIEESDGPSNRPRWKTVGVINDTRICEGIGATKQVARRQAAGAFMNFLTKQTGDSNPSRDRLVQMLRSLLE